MKFSLILLYYFDFSGPFYAEQQVCTYEIVWRLGTTNAFMSKLYYRLPYLYLQLNCEST